MTKKVDILVGLQFGSEGKGLIAGHLARVGGYDTVVNCNMPNAGHTYIIDDKEYIFKVLPNGAVHDHIEKVMLGPDSVFSLDRLMLECQMVGPQIWDKLIIHENAMILQRDHAIIESNLDRIGSTKQGSAAAMVDKIYRLPGILAADEYELRNNVVTHEQWMNHLNDSNSILLEGCQGFSLGLNAGFYPYCTSRDCTPTRLLAGAGIPYQWARDVIGVARLHPIRVGGNSGPGYKDQEETTWESVGQKPELTTVTKRERRIFNFSEIQMRSAIISCQPDRVFLNFCNYDPALAEIQTHQLNWLLERHGPEDAYTAYWGWGPADKDIRYGI
jgi:adenylosuccinate synthase